MLVFRVTKVQWVSQVTQVLQVERAPLGLWAREGEMGPREIQASLGLLVTGDLEELGSV